MHVVIISFAVVLGLLVFCFCFFYRSNVDSQQNLRPRGSFAVILYHYPLRADLASP